MKKIIVILIVFLATFVGWKLFYSNSTSQITVKKLIEDHLPAVSHPLMIEEMRKRSYEGSPITVEETLAPGNNYEQYIVSYISDGNKIFALMTIPMSNSGQAKPKNGWPVIVFNHGYIPPKEYVTTERYIAYVDSFARNGYIVFKSDYRGNGNSEGTTNGAYYSPDYTIDVLQAVASLKKYKDADPTKIGMWGHSMGGSITMRSMVVSKDIKVGVIWGGVVGSYSDLAHRWRRPQTTSDLSPQDATRLGSIRNQIIKMFGDPDTQSPFWKAIDPYSYLKDISGPIQLHHGLSDETVPWQFSQNFKEALVKAGKSVELYTYEGADHNISSPSFEVAMARSIQFFNKYLK